MVDAKVGSLIIPAVVDTRCAQTMIKAGLLLPHVGEEDISVNILCLHGATYTYERHCLSLIIMGRTKDLPVGMTKMFLASCC